MAHAFSSDMTNANKSALISSLQIASQETIAFSNLISRFRSETVNGLKGPGYDMIRNKMSLYQDALQKMSIICTNLESNLRAANNSGLNAMCGYSELDTKNLPEIRVRLNNTKTMLGILETKVKVKNSDGKEVSRTIGSDENIATYKKLVDELDKLIKALEELDGKIDAARGMLNSSETDSFNFSSTVSGISVSVYN